MITPFRLDWLVLASVIAVSCDRAFAQITPDNTLGEESSVVNSVDELSDRIIDPTGTYRLPNGKLILSRECS